MKRIKVDCGKEKEMKKETKECEEEEGVKMHEKEKGIRGRKEENDGAIKEEGERAMLVSIRQLWQQVEALE